MALALGVGLRERLLVACGRNQAERGIGQVYDDVPDGTQNRVDPGGDRVDRVEKLRENIPNSRESEFEPVVLEPSLPPS